MKKIGFRTIAVCVMYAVFLAVVLCSCELSETEYTFDNQTGYGITVVVNKQNSFYLYPRYSIRRSYAASSLEFTWNAGYWSRDTNMVYAVTSGSTVIFRER